MNYITWGMIDRLVEDILTSPHMLQCVQFTHNFLISLGVPENHTPSAEQLLLSVTAVIVTLSSYWYWLGKNHLRKRRDLENKLTKVTSFSSLSLLPFFLSHFLPPFLCLSLFLSFLLPHFPFHFLPSFPYFLTTFSHFSFLF